MTTRNLVIDNRWALGDTVCLSAAVRDLHLAYPGQFSTSMVGHYLSHWQQLPYITPPVQPYQLLNVKYKDGIEASHKGKFKGHFLTWFHRWLGEQLGITIPMTRPSGDIRLTRHEDRRLVHGRYWVVVTGGKLDMTAKWWSHERYQQVVDQLKTLGIPCVQAGANFHRHIHKPLTNCVSTIGMTDAIRDLYTLIKHADGVICGITGAMHIAAVFDRPCVVLAGGREDSGWEAYTSSGQWPTGCAPVITPHRFLHTIGLLDCCKDHGCWKKRTVPIEPADTNTREGLHNLCKRPNRSESQVLPECMSMITVRHVIEGVLSYYKNGTLMPITESKTTLIGPPAIQAPNPVPVEINLASRQAESPDYRTLDHPTIGGKYTLFILAYGPHFDILKRCVESILSSTPIGRLDIRIALNQPCQESLDFVTKLVADKIVTKMYTDFGERRKYPAMREMFYDPDCPITTKYLIWFDDDAKVVDPKWMLELTKTILANHRTGNRLYGATFTHDLMMYAKDGHRPDKWFKDASWWRGVDLRLPGRINQLAPNGSAILFAVGWCWALCVETMQQAGIPDTRLSHNGGDICIGEQVKQAGYKIKLYNSAKSLVWCPTKEAGGRRGHREVFPWCPLESIS